MLTRKKIPYVNEKIKMTKGIKILGKKKLGILIIRNKFKKTIGVITDGQIRRYNQKHSNLHNITAKEVMTKNPISIDKNTLAVRALSLMNNKKITSLCVHNKNKNKTIGVLHIHNILQSNVS